MANGRKGAEEELAAVSDLVAGNVQDEQRLRALEEVVCS